MPSRNGGSGILLLGLVAVVALVALPASARAQGSAVITHGSCATAMAAAGVADPCDDGSAVLFNPAALALQPSVVGLGWTGIRTGGDFTYDFIGARVSRETSTTSVPFGFASYRVTPTLAAAIGVFAPYGLGVDWPEEFEGRFVSYRTNLRNIYIQPTVAYAATPWLSLGAGLDVIRGSIEIQQRLDLAEVALPAAPFPGATFGSIGIPVGTDFADATLSGTGNAVTFHVGALVTLAEELSLGVRYLHSAEVPLAGDARFTRIPTGIVLPPGNPISQPGNALGLPAGAPVPLDAILQGQFAPGAALSDQPIRTRIPLPAQLVVGLAYHPIPNLRLLGDYQWMGWSLWDETAIRFENPATADQLLVLDYQDTHTWRVGAEFGMGELLDLRAGFIYNTPAQRDFAVSPLLPEAERNYYSLGAGYRITDALSLDFAYQHVDQADRRGRVRARAPGLTEPELQALNVGVYSADASVFNFTLSYRFGPRW
jgi:long-chain fatty acid transport protein